MYKRGLGGCRGEYVQVLQRSGNHVVDGVTQEVAVAASRVCAAFGREGWVYIPGDWGGYRAVWFLRGDFGRNLLLLVLVDVYAVTKVVELLKGRHFVLGYHNFEKEGKC